MTLHPADLTTLRGDDWFAGLAAQQQQQLVSYGKRRSLTARQLLFSRGDPFCGIYVLVRGQLLISGLHQSGRQSLLTLVTAGQWFGEIAWFDQKPRTHDAEALSDCELWQLSPQALQQLVQLDPLWWQYFGRLLTVKLRQLFVELEDRAVLTARQRMVRRLFQLSAQNTRVPLQQEQLGQLLSLSRQTTNQLLQQLAAAGLISTGYGGIEVVDRAALLLSAQD